MKAIIFAVLALAFAATAAQAPNRPKRPRQPNQVHAQGCVEAGVEAHCLVVKDIKSGILYNLLIKGARPQLRTGIDFAGVLHQGPTYCMQGIAVDVLSWKHNDSIKCPPSQLPKQRN